MGDRRWSTSKKVSLLKWAAMEEKQSGTGNPSIDAETNTENHNNAHIQGGYSRLIGHLRQNYNHSVIWICMYFY